MLRLDKVIKPWKEAAALNDHINLYGFWNETAFLTKSGDVGMVLCVSGVDYESLDHAEQEYAVKRLEAALKAFGPGFHVYQYLFKQNRPEIPFAHYDDPVVEAAIDQRRQFFDAKRDRLYQIEIFYCVVLEGARSKTGINAALARLLRDPAGAIDELKTQFAVYAAAKAAVRSFLRAWTVELKDRKIRVNAVSPGPIETQALEKAGIPPEMLEQAIAGFASQVPLGRRGKPEEIAAAVAFFASDESSYITGVELAVAGGMAQV